MESIGHFMFVEKWYICVGKKSYFEKVCSENCFPSTPKGSSFHYILYSSLLGLFPEIFYAYRNNYWMGWFAILFCLKQIAKGSRLCLVHCTLFFFNPVSWKCLASINPTSFFKIFDTWFENTFSQLYFILFILLTVFNFDGV